MRSQNTSRTKRGPGSSRGFSLIELLIAVAIILIIAAIVIPNLLSSRMASNEASAVASIRTINSAQTSYSWTWSNGFTANLTALGGPAGAAASCNNAEIIDPVLSASNASVKSGYTFTAGPGLVQMAAPPGCGLPGYSDGYTVIAWPTSVGSTGQRSFCGDNSGTIQYLATGVQPAPAAPLCAGMTGLLGN
jgi:type IV pilus assembly protein PilA